MQSLNALRQRLLAAIVAAVPASDVTRHAHWLDWVESIVTTGRISSQEASVQASKLHITADGQHTKTDEALWLICRAAQCYATAVEWSGQETPYARDYDTRHYVDLSGTCLDKVAALLGVEL
jgi:hypothetical protein